jgi:predicted DNA-binding ArsR family transcriptional regulator
MTRIERERNQRPWLKTEKLVVTTKFQECVQSPHLVNGLDPHLLAWVIHTVVSRSEDYELFTNINRSVWSNRLGSNYRRFLDWLVVNEILEENVRYRNDSKNPEKNYSMSFRVKGLNDSNVFQQLVVITRTLSRVSHFNDQSELNDNVTRYVHQCLQELTVNKDLVVIHDSVREALALEQCKRIWSGSFNLHYGEKSQRLFHSVIMMVREGRQNLRLRTSGEVLVYCDVKTCFPNLLVNYIQDPNEKAVWLDALNHDLYDVARNKLNSNHSRDEVKVEFSKFLSDPKHPTNNVPGRFLETLCPLLLETIRGDPNMALNLQNLEASILVHQMVNWAILHHIWYVPMFDGFLCKHQHLVQVVNQATNLLEQRLGHRPVINHHVLG